MSMTTHGLMSSTERTPILQGKDHENPTRRKEERELGREASKEDRELGREASETVTWDGESLEQALKLPGIIEYAVHLFFVKLGEPFTFV